MLLRPGSGSIVYHDVGNDYCLFGKFQQFCHGAVAETDSRNKVNWVECKYAAVSFLLKPVYPGFFFFMSEYFQ